MDKKKIRELRQKNNLSQIQFAVKLGVSVRTVQGWENGRCPSNIALHQLNQLAK